ncbi:MAG: multicomponent Na+:H+ antiporter subunit D, partial [Natronomonas sp.]
MTEHDVILALLIAVPIIAAVVPLLLSLRTTETGWYVAIVAAAVEAVLAAVVVRSVYAGNRL